LELDSRSNSRTRLKSDVTTVLSRREREILDIVYRLGEGTAEQIRTELSDAPHYSTVRSLLRVLEEKGHLTHGERNLRYVYRAVMPKPKAAQLAVERILATFFDSSVDNLLRALLSRMSLEQLNKARHILDDTRKQRRHHEAIEAWETKNIYFRAFLTKPVRL
jgi:predicted transcriptional regulator